MHVDQKMYIDKYIYHQLMQILIDDEQRYRHIDEEEL